MLRMSYQHDVLVPAHKVALTCQSELLHKTALRVTRRSALATAAFYAMLHVKEDRACTLTGGSSYDKTLNTVFDLVCHQSVICFQVKPAIFAVWRLYG